MAEVKLELTCGRCKAKGEFEHEGAVNDAMELAREAGWVYDFRCPVGTFTRSLVAYFCASCDQTTRYEYKPSTLSLFGGAYDAIRAGQS